jgi:TQO small subunit DoxA
MVGQFSRERAVREPVRIDVELDKGCCLLPDRVVAGHENHATPHQRWYGIIIPGEGPRGILIICRIGSRHLDPIALDGLGSSARIETSAAIRVRTMAACNLAIGATLMLGGSAAFSLDNALLARKPALAEQGWFRWMSGALPLPMQSSTFQKFALAVFAATVIFNVDTYNHYRGSVVTPFHGGPVSPSKHHLSLTDGVVLPNGAVRFHAYLDGGTPAAPSNVMTAALKSIDGTVLEQWDGSALSRLPASAISNEFAYNRFAPGPFGLRAQMGATATITLPATSAAGIGGVHGAATLELRTVNGNSFKVAVRPG